MYKNKEHLGSALKRVTLAIFDFLDGHTTSNRNKWRFRALAITGATMGITVILSLYFKSNLVYPRLNRSSSLPDVTQILNDYLQLLTDLYHVNKYDMDACAGYYRQYYIVDTFLNRQSETQVKSRLAKLILIFNIFWMINITLHCASLIYEFYWSYCLMFVPFHVFVYFKMLTTLSMNSHAIRIESRLRNFGGLMEDYHDMVEKNQELSTSDECALIDDSQQQARSQESKRMQTKITQLDRYYLILIEQCEFVNNMFGLRILPLTLNLTIDMVRFINSLYRYVGGNQFSVSHDNPHTLAAPSVWRVLVCVVMLFSLVHHCERAYKQTDRILRLCDPLLVLCYTGPDSVRASVSSLRELVVSRPASFSVASYFRLEYPVLTAIAATVVSYSIILFQST